MEIKTKKILAPVIITAVSINAFWAYSASLEHYAALSVVPTIQEVRVIEEEEQDMYEYVFNTLKEQLGLKEAIMGVAIVQCESSWRDDIAIIEPNDTISTGLFMINSIHKPTISYTDMLDYKKATQWAIDKRIADGSWNAWTCAR